jgi:hypothetical protein
LAYASSLADQQSGHARSDLRAPGAALIAPSVIAAVVAGVLKRRLLQDK